MKPHLPAGVHFVPAHPVAGTEHSGPDAGFAELFDNRWCILTPPEGTDPGRGRDARGLLARLGANVETMTPEHHDLVLAITSHVPHLIAYNIVGTAADLETVTESEVMKFSAGGFRDFTRIAASDPTMWRDVFLNNKEAVLEMLGRFTEDLTALQRRSAGARATSCSSCSRAPARSAAASSPPARRRGARFRPSARHADPGVKAGFRLLPGGGQIGVALRQADHQRTDCGRSDAPRTIE
jgi:hypothetical protein